MATTLFKDQSWHWHPTMYLTCKYTATRDNEKSPTVHYKFEFDNEMGPGARYGASNALGIEVTVDGDSDTCYLIGDDYDDTSNTLKFDRRNKNTSGSSDVSIYIWCHQGTYANPTGTSNNCNAASGSKKTQIGERSSCPYHGTWSGTVSYPKYNPYTPSSIWLNPNDYTKIAKIQSSSSTGSGRQWGIHYSYNAGSNSNVPISLAIHDYDATQWGVRWEPVVRTVNGSSDGVWDYYNLGTDKGFTDGNRYRITLVSKGGEALSPSSWDPRQGLVIYTYRIPTLNNSITATRTSQNANQDNKFTISGTNNRAWSAYENDFVTRYRIKRGSADYTGWTSLGNITSWSRTAAEMRSLVPKANDGQNIILQMERWSTIVNTGTTIYESTNKPTVTFTVYYRPRIGIVNNDVSYKDTANNNIPKSKVIPKSKLTDITVSWTYDTTRDQAGYTQGYRVRLYNNVGTVVKTYYTTSKSYKIPNGDIPSNGLLTYIDVTPYFNNDSTNPNDYWYYNNTIDRIPFVIVMNKLNTPTITYPINNNTWINDDFRICFELPIDPDKDSVSGTYKYDNIEFSINNKVYKLVNSEGTTSGASLINNNYTFSSEYNDLTYQKKIVIWPNSENITKSNSYTMKVRVKKPYNATVDTDYGWSDWSSTVTITKKVPTYSVSQNQIIMASHYNEVRDAVENAKNTYNITSTIPDKATSKTTIIKREQYYYDSIFKRINETKNRVNTYATFFDDRTKFDKDNQIITSFTTSQEKVTAAKNGTDGRNYIQYIYDNVILLK